MLLELPERLLLYHWLDVAGFEFIDEVVVVGHSCRVGFGGVSLREDTCPGYGESIHLQLNVRRGGVNICVGEKHNRVI